MHVRIIEQRHRPGQHLGRHEEHDPRSVAYAHGVRPKSQIKPVSWTRRIPILNQGQVGSCTGNALTGAIGTDSLGRTATTSVTVKADSKGIFSAGVHVLDESFALKGYELNTRLDNVSGQYLPDDTGSSGIACGKSGQQLGLFVSYTHAFSIDALKSALQTGAVMVGIPWLNSMFDPESDGTIVVDKASGEAGGHEFVVSAWDGARFRMDNSWDTSWGDGGSGYFAEADLAWLLSQGGDVTVPQFASMPQPIPTPTPVPPTPVPPDVDKALAASIRARRADEDAWLKAKGL